MSPEEFEMMLNHVVDIIPKLKHCEKLGIDVLHAEHAKLSLSLPYSQSIIGNPDTGVIHGGALTTLMDTACGFAAILGLDTPSIAPTLDLRIDYMRPATVGKTVIGKAEAYRITPTVVFARGVAYHEDDPEKPIAHCTASFMRLGGNQDKTASDILQEAAQ